MTVFVDECVAVLALAQCSALAVASHCEYRVLQATLFKKPGRNPRSDRIVQVTGHVGATVHSTGRCWTGPRGGRWVELDSLVEKPGWLLIEGPGFDIPGPMLQKWEPGDEPPYVFSVVRPVPGVTREYRDLVIGPRATVSEAKMWLALFFGLEPSQLIIAAPQTDEKDPVLMGVKSYFTGMDGLLPDSITMFDAGYRDGDELQYVYTGCPGEGEEVEFFSRLQAGRDVGLRAPQQRTKTIKEVLLRWPELVPHFAVLELPEEALQDDIKRQYRRLALSCHPDKCPDEVEFSTRRFQAIKAAFDSIRAMLRL